EGAARQHRRGPRPGLTASRSAGGATPSQSKLSERTSAMNILGAGVAIAATLFGISAPHAQPAKPAIVLVHGAFADASSWNGVAKFLEHDGYPVIAVANPLRGVASDAAYVADIVATLPAPVVLVGHSYGGSVISEAAKDEAKVKA